MASHESTSQSDEWFTPPWLFEVLGIEFDLDPCYPNPFFGYDGPYTPCKHVMWESSHLAPWDKYGSIWLNPPYGGRNGIRPWLQKLSDHGNGIALVPNRTATDWWQDFAEKADALLFVRGKIKFIRPDGTVGGSPGYGNVLMAYGEEMATALLNSKIRGLRHAALVDQ